MMPDAGSHPPSALADRPGLERPSGVMRPVRRMARWLALGVLGSVAAPACGDAFGVEAVFGIWNTMSINGYAVPGTVVYEGESYETEYVRWVFYDDGHCTLTQHVDGITTTYGECDYTVNVELQTITMIFQFEAWDGSVDGNRMTLTDPKDAPWVLGRQ